jgi:hypothetical protein
MAFEFCCNDATRESYHAVFLDLFDCFSSENLWVVQPWLIWIPSRWEQFHYTSLLSPSLLFLEFKIFVGCATSAPDGCSPRGYSRKNVLSIGSSSFCFFHPSCSCMFLLNNNVRCAPSAPDGSSPRGYSQTFSSIDSKTSFLHWCLISCVKILSGTLISTAG